MEPDKLVQMIGDVQSQNAKLGTVGGDDDTTGIKRARQIFGHELQKASGIMCERMLANNYGP